LCSDSLGDRSGDFTAGFLLGGAIFGTLAYVFAPQVISSCFSFFANLTENYL